MSNILQDPDNIADGKYDLLNEKIEVVRALIARSPDKKGFPFIYIFASSKNHILKEIKLPVYTDDEGNTEYFYTAATDGKNYYWSPQMIEKFTPRELAIIMCHETYHVVLQHCIPDRALGKNRKIWNIAVDYVVNGMIEHDVRQSWKNLNVNDNYRGRPHPLWNGNLGKPLYFDELKNSIRAEVKQAKAFAAANRNKTRSAKLPAQNPTPAPAPIAPPATNTIKKKAKPRSEDLCFYSDYSILGKSAEQIYDEIMDEFKELTQDDIQEILDGLGSSVDEHMDTGLSRNQLLKEILDAAQTAKQMAGTVPGGIEDQLLKLREPKLSAWDLVRNIITKKRHEKGSINDWSRFRRRAISMGMYSPKKKDDFIRWCAFLDTSGSMSQEDLTYAVSQLKCLDGRSEGIIVPNDAQPYWDKATNVRNVGDLETTKIVGRGGTVFKEIFEDFRKHIKKELDVLIILTDGGIFDLDQLKNPGIDVVWVLTTSYDFKPPFGRVAPLRSY